MITKLLMGMRPTNNPSNEFSNKQSRELAGRLSESHIFQDYQKAFFESSGLPLAIRPIECFQMALHDLPAENPFCALMAQSNKGCVNCLEVQSKMEQGARLKPKTIQCFAGLCDTMVPVRIGHKLIAFLQTGQTLLKEPTKQEFDRISKRVMTWGADINLKELEEAYYNSRVLTESQYRGFINLLRIFSEHLALIGNAIDIKERSGEPPSLSRSRAYIEDHYDHKLRLEEVAKKVNMSVRYFCKVFKKHTGLTFIDYLTRLRIEKAKNLLLNSNKRISEVAFEVGFESLTQFNRSFKNLCGQTPTQYRKES